MRSPYERTTPGGKFTMATQIAIEIGTRLEMKMEMRSFGVFKTDL